MNHIVVSKYCIHRLGGQRTVNRVASIPAACAAVDEHTTAPIESWIRRLHLIL
jgi:hypothetical protein